MSSKAARILVLGVLLLVAGCAQSAPVPTATPVGSDNGGSQMQLVGTPTQITSTPTQVPTPLPTSTAIPSPSATATQTASPSPSPSVTARPTQAGETLLDPPKTRPVAVMIDDDRRARPQSGLLKADIVYESIAEFDLTRFLAIYLTGAANEVGPIRSTRAYFATMAADYGAALAHCLDVPSVPAVIAAGGVVDLDACKVAAPTGFWRDSSRSSPFNLYANASVLRDEASGRAGADWSWGGFAHRRPWPAGGEAASGLKFVFPSPHEVIWRYDSSTGKYLRWKDGSAHVDRSGQQVSTDNVVVMFAKVTDSAYWNESGYHEVALTGEGAVVAFSGGQVQRGTWRRSDVASSTRFYDEQGDDLLLQPGRVFVQVVAMGVKLNLLR